VADFIDGKIIVRDRKSYFVENDKYFIIEGIYLKVFEPKFKSYMIYNKSE